MLLGGKEDKDTGTGVGPATGITETRGALKAQSSKYGGGGSSAPRAPGNSLGGEPGAGGPTSGRPRV